MNRRCVAAVLFASVLSATARAHAAGDRGTDVGLFTAIVAGTHVGADNPVPVGGLVPGAALELTQHFDRLRFHLEGIPTIGAATSAVGPFGRTSASLSLFNATVLFDLDRQRRFRLGGGYQFVNLSNANGTNGDRNAVRVASPIVAAGTTLPLGAARFIEANVLVDPNLRGTLLIYGVGGNARTNKPEQGAEVDYGAAYGWRRGDVEYLLGARALSYHTRNIANGELVDRNVGGGVTFEVRFLFGSR